MTEPSPSTTDLYRVVVNDEGFHSIWSVDRPLPLGWTGSGKQGTRQECLDHIEQVWTDMRPLSVRRENAVGQA